MVRTTAELDLVGGSLPLDLANTINSRVAPEHDYIDSHSNLAAWLERASVVTAPQKKALIAQGHLDEAGAADTVRAAMALREAIHMVFASLARGEDPPDDALDELLATYARAIRKAGWERTADGLRPHWDVVSNLIAPLHPIAYLAVALLVSEESSLVRSCPGCGWLFIDATRNHSRRWCDMATCGSRAKMRRYHQRRKAQSSAD